MTRLWHGFAPMGAVDGAEFVLVRGEGSRIWDREGREYLDATAGLWFCQVGHGRREIADAAAAQMTRLAAHHCFGDHANEPAIELADRIAAIAPVDDGAVFFGSGGSDAIDTAGKLARRYWSAIGKPKKTMVISREHGYHGVNGYGTSLVGIPANREGFGTLVSETARVRYDDPEDLEETLDRHWDSTAAFVGEPVIGAGGVLPPPDGYWEKIATICREREILFVQDEVICGFGRLGTWFGAQRYGVSPDLVTFAKGVTSGYLPLGGVVASARIREPFWERGGPAFRHGYTYTGHAAVCAAAIANLDIIEREGLVDRVGVLEPVLAEALERVRGLPGIGDVRAVGLVGAIEIDEQLRAARPAIVEEAVVAARAHGVVTRGLRGVALQLSPPLVVTAEELETMVDGIAAGIRDVVPLAA